MFFRHYCAECKDLNTKKEKKGKVSGKLYECKKLKKAVNPACECCEKFTKSDRKLKDWDKLYQEGKEYYNDTTPAWVVFTALIILIILGLIMGIFK